MREEEEHLVRGDAKKAWLMEGRWEGKCKNTTYPWM
jgi:hypothetical protein